MDVLVRHAPPESRETFALIQSYPFSIMLVSNDERKVILRVRVIALWIL